MALLAVQHIRRMRGGAQGHLMLCADGNLYVVKFQNNPQHIRVLANELIASRLAAAVGLSTPPAELIEVSPWLIDHTPELRMDVGKTHEPCVPGLQFGSRFAGGLMPGQVLDYLPEGQLGEIRNLDEFAGILAFDKWTGNANGRQVVYARKQREHRYKAIFIDFGYCFYAGEWRFEDVPLRGVYFRNDVYQGVTGWESFDPWLTRLENLPDSIAWAAANEVPPEWYGGHQHDMEQLIAHLLVRRSRIRDLLSSFRNSDRHPFPNWGQPHTSVTSTHRAGAPLRPSLEGRVQ